MNKFTITDVAMMTGLTTRTIRNYISDGFLLGDKSSGKWLFTTEQVDAFMDNSSVKPALLAKKNAIVYDFMASPITEVEKMCIVLDITDKHAGNASTLFCEILAETEPEVELHFASNPVGKGIRVILSGSASDVLGVAGKYYEKR